MSEAITATEARELIKDPGYILTREEVEASPWAFHIALLLFLDDERKRVITELNQLRAKRRQLAKRWQNDNF